MLVNVRGIRGVDVMSCHGRVRDAMSWHAVMRHAVTDDYAAHEADDEQLCRGVQWRA